MRLKYAVMYLAKIFRFATIESFVKQYSGWCGNNNFVSRPFRSLKITKLYASALSRTQLVEKPGQTFV